MKYPDLSVAYQLLKKYQLSNTIGAYKVGGSNLRSADFFDYDGVLLGAISADNIFHSAIPKNYPLAELEIIAKIRVTNSQIGSYLIEAYHWGIECPFISVENKHGDPWICICDNCSAGDLLIYEEISLNSINSVKLISGEDVKAIGKLENLIYSVEEIVAKSIDIIREHNLPLEEGFLYIASGGITDVFQLHENENLRIVVEK